MFVLIDMDGTICNILDYWLEEYNKKTGENLKQENITIYGVENICKYPSILFDILNSDGFFLKAKPYDGAIEAINEINQYFTVLICTKVPSKSKSAYYDKVSWLNKYLPFIPQDNIISISSYRSLINASFIIDDYPENLKCFNGCKILIDRPWNKDCNDQLFDFNRISSWLQIRDFILK